MSQAHRDSQAKVNWKKWDAKEFQWACKTREELRPLDQDLEREVTEKIENGCEHIIREIAYVFRRKKEVASRRTEPAKNSAQTTPKASARRGPVEENIRPGALHSAAKARAFQRRTGSPRSA